MRSNLARKLIRSCSAPANSRVNSSHINRNSAFFSRNSCNVNFFPSSVSSFPLSSSPSPRSANRQRNKFEVTEEEKKNKFIVENK